MPTVDSTNPVGVQAFFDHLRPRDIAAEQFARLLIDEGWTVQEFWGPEQMDVWRLTLARGDCRVQFGVERGFSDGVSAAAGDPVAKRNRYRPIAIVVFAWARARGIRVQMDDPDELNPDLMSHGIAALEWFADGHAAVVERVAEAWMAYRLSQDRLRARSGGTPDPHRSDVLRAKGVAAMEAAATAL